MTVTRTINTVTENQPYLRDGKLRPTKFKLGRRTEYEPRTPATRAVTSNLKAVVGGAVVYKSLLVGGGGILMCRPHYRPHTACSVTLIFCLVLTAKF